MRKRKIQISFSKDQVKNFAGEIQIKIFGVLQHLPLRKNLVPEISADPQIDVGALPEESPLFPMLPHPLCDCSIEP